MCLFVSFFLRGARQLLRDRCPYLGTTLPTEYRYSTQASSRLRHQVSALSWQSASWGSQSDD